MNNVALLAPLALVLLTGCTHVVPDTPTPPAETPAGPTEAVEPARAPDTELGSRAVRVPIDGLPSFGSSRALVTIVAFTDYECSYCAKAEAELAKIRAAYGDRVRMVIANHPLPMHVNGKIAARAFLAGAAQGKTEAMHTRLFSGGGKLDDDGVRAISRELGLEAAGFERVRLAAETEAALERNHALARSLAVQGTPTFFINGRRITGAQPPDVIRAVIDEELVKAQALVARGVPAEHVYTAILATLPSTVPAAKVAD